MSFNSTNHLLSKLTTILKMHLHHDHGPHKQAVNPYSLILLSHFVHLVQGRYLSLICSEIVDTYAITLKT